MSNRKAIGIDLGTTTSLVGLYNLDKGIVEIVPYSKTGSTIIPSIVSFFKDQLLIGEAAKSSYYKNVESTVKNIKRLIGLSYEEYEKIKKNLNFPYKIIKDPKRDAPLIITNYKNKLYQLTPEQISSIILIFLKKQAKNYTNQEILDAVITVPNEFNQKQINATKDAAKIAGLNVLRIIKEPIAAAIAYGFRKKFLIGRKIMIFDFGGGTLDISILSLENKIYDVLYSKGDNCLGGEDFDNKLVEYCIQNFKEEKGIDLNIDKNNSKNVRARCRLMMACEQLKKDLSNSMEANFDIENLLNGENFEITIERRIFEGLCEDLFERTENLLKSIFKESKIDKNSIDKVILVGGTSNIPRIKEIVQKFFEDKFTFNNEKILPDHLVASGAAIVASSLIGVNKSFILMDKYPKTIGIGIAGGKMNVIIPKNSYIPIEVKKSFTTFKDNQTNISLSIYEGDNEYVKDNTLLSKINVKVPPKKAKEVQIEITFSLDVNSILHINVVEKKLGIKIDEQIECNKLSEEYIKEISKNNEKLFSNVNMTKIKIKKSQTQEIYKETDRGDNDGTPEDNNNISKKKTTFQNINNNKINNNNKFSQTKTLSQIEEDLKENDLNNFSLLQVNYLDSLKEYLEVYYEKLKQNTLKDENEIKSHLHKITFYVNKVDLGNIKLLIPNLLILKDFPAIYNNIIVNLLNKLYEYAENQMNYGNINEANDNFQLILKIEEGYKIGIGLDFLSPLKKIYDKIINNSTFYLQRISINEKLKIGDDLLKNRKYTQANEKFLEVYNTIIKNPNKDNEYEAKCLSKILFAKYQLMVSSNNNRLISELKDLTLKIENLIKYLDIKSLQKNDWYLDYKSIKNNISTPFGTTPKGDVNNDPVIQIENKFKNLATSEFIEYIIENYPIQGVEKYKLSKSELLKNPKNIIKDLSSKYHTDGIKENSTIEGQKTYIVHDKISKLLNSILINENIK